MTEHGAAAATTTTTTTTPATPGYGEPIGAGRSPVQGQQRGCAGLELDYPGGQGRSLLGLDGDRAGTPQAGPHAVDAAHPKHVDASGDDAWDATHQAQRRSRERVGMYAGEGT